MPANESTRCTVCGAPGQNLSGGFWIKLCPKHAKTSSQEVNNVLKQDQKLDSNKKSSFENMNKPRPHVSMKPRDVVFQSTQKCRILLKKDLARRSRRMVKAGGVKGGTELP